MRQASMSIGPGLWYGLIICGLTLGLVACATPQPATVSAQPMVVSIAVTATLPMPTVMPTPAITAQVAVEAALAASQAQSHIRLTGTLSRDLKLLTIQAAWMAPDRFHFQSDDLEFIKVADRFYLKQADAWAEMGDWQSAELQNVLDELWPSTPQILYAQLLGSMAVDGVDTQVYEYIARVKTGQTERLQQVKLWVRQQDNLPIKREASYEADGAQVFEVQFVEYDPNLVATAANSAIDTPIWQSNTANAWKEFVSPAGFFALLLPGNPTENIQTVETPVGAIDFHQFTVEMAGGYYTVSYGDYPPNTVDQRNPEALLIEAQAAALAHTRGTLVAETPFTVDVTAQHSYPGRAVRIARQEGGELIRLRIVLVGNRLYQVVAIGTPAIIANSTTNQFLDSFRLLEE